MITTTSSNRRTAPKRRKTRVESPATKRREVYVGSQQVAPALAVTVPAADPLPNPEALAQVAVASPSQPALIKPGHQNVAPGSALENALVEQYIPLVRNVVGRVAMTLPPHVDGEDLFSAGLGGLLNAIRNYNPRAGTSFETYARLRIRGAVFDELRRMDWVPRSVHTKARRVQGVMRELEQEKGRPPTESEMATALKISLVEYNQWLEEIRPATFVCLDAAMNSEMDDSVSQYESLADARQENPLDGTFKRELSQIIADRLDELPEMQRKVLALYYFEDMRLREIAEVFDLTESRICQIHAQAILAIKAVLEKFDPYFV